VKLHQRHINMNIHPVHQRAGDFGHVAFNLGRRAAAPPHSRAEITARAGIHRRNQNKPCRKTKCPFGTGDGNLSFLKRLTNHLEHVAGKLRKLIKKEDAVMSQRQFPRSRMGSAANQRRPGSRMMRGPHGACGNQCLVFGKKADGRINPRGLQRLRQGHRRKDGSHSLRQHCLAGAGRPNHNQIMPAGSGNRQRPLD